MQEVWGKQVFTSLHALHITQPTFTLGTTTTQATPKFRASRWSSVGCWKPWLLHLWAALLIDTTISYLLVSPRWPLTGIIYQLYAPDLGIQSWICINLDGHGRHFTCPYPSSIGYTSQNRAINSILDVSEWIASEVICWACHWWVDMCSWGWQVRPKSMLNLVEELGQMKSAEWECTCGLWISIVEQVCCCHFG